MHNKRVVHEEIVAPDDSQVGEQLPHGPQPVHLKDDEVIGDLLQVGEAQPLEVLLLGVVVQHDPQVARDHRAVPQLVHQVVDGHPGVDGAADPPGRRGRRQQHQRRDSEKTTTHPSVRSHDNGTPPTTYQVTSSSRCVATHVAGVLSISETHTPTSVALLTEPPPRATPTSTLRRVAPPSSLHEWGEQKR